MMQTDSLYYTSMCLLKTLSGIKNGRRPLPIRKARGEWDKQ